MKKFFQSIGMITLVFCSFWYTDKTASVVKESDEVMIQIKESKKNETTGVIEAFVQDEEMIPGVHGMEIDIEKSYQKMKEIGYFDTSFFIYEEVKPKSLLKNNFDKYIISGNKEKKQISFLFLIEENTNKNDVNQIIDILKEKKLNVDMFVDGNFLEKNNDVIYNIIKQNHFIGNLSYNYDYNNPSFLWLDAVIKRLNHSKEGFCYLTKQNKNALNLCSMYKNHTIIPNYILTNNYYLTLKKYISAGNLIGIKITDQLIKELPLMIDYIKSRGYDITNLQKHLEE